MAEENTNRNTDSLSTREDNQMVGSTESGLVDDAEELSSMSSDNDNDSRNSVTEIAPAPSRDFHGHGILASPPRTTVPVSPALAISAATRTSAEAGDGDTISDADMSDADIMEDEDGSGEEQENNSDGTMDEDIDDSAVIEDHEDDDMDEDGNADADNEQDETHRAAFNAAIENARGALSANARLAHTLADTAHVDNVPIANAAANAPANHVPNTDHFVMVNRGDAVEETSACKVCLIDPDPMEAVYVECGHVWCKGCLNQYFATVFTNRDAFPPKCCRPEGFEIGMIQMHLEEQVLMQVMEKWEEWSAENPTYCANIQCRAFVSADQIDGQVATCLLCKVRTCIECNTKMILHHLPDQHPAPVADKVNEELAQKEGWKRCPNAKCSRFVEKTEGCDTMTCKCGRQFCYRCGNSFDGPFPCTCSDHNAWVGQVQAWANGADDHGDGEEDSDDSEDSADGSGDEDEDDEEDDGDDGNETD